MSADSEKVADDIGKMLEGIGKGTTEIRFDSPEILGKLGVSVAKHFKRSVEPKEERVREPGLFYASEIGSLCQRKIWFNRHRPGMAQPASASMAMKFLYGNVIEDVVLSLAKLAGHTVSNEQHPYEYERGGIRIRGRIDAILNDDAVVDVKSTTTYGFKEFKEGRGDAKFGYGPQLAFYKHVTGKDKAGFIAVDKQLGHILYAPLRTNLDLHKLVDRLAKIEKEGDVDKVQLPFEPDPEGKSGNTKLCVECSYCQYNKTCFPTVRKFAYSGKVVHLVKVVKEPAVPEITEDDGDE